MSALNKKSVKDIDVSGKRVLVRCDFNVPLQDGKITSDKRIVASLPTIKYLIDHHAKVILCSHLGRPKGEFKPEFSLAPVAARLSELLGQDVKMAKDVIGDSAKELAANLKDGEVMLLENVRFHAEETKNDPAFSKALASLADIYVNDAFGSAHRAHSSTTGVADYLPAVCGYLVQKEVSIMGKALADPERPFVAILGGAKVSDKLNVINNLLEKVDTLIIGGGMAYTFAKAQGGKIGNSICEDDKLQLALDIIAKAKAKGVNLVLGTDCVAADAFSNDANTQICPVNDIPDGWEGMDAGPASRKAFAAAIEGAKTILWNGPAGVFEFDKFAEGSRAIAEAIAKATAEGAFSLIGGGDSVACINKFGMADQVSYISTGGGALLEAIEGKELPGVAAICKK